MGEKNSSFIHSIVFLLCPSIYLLTWNVVTVEPPPLDQLQNLLEMNADFIAIGLQEVKSQPQNLITDALYEDSWTNSLR